MNVKYFWPAALSEEAYQQACMQLCNAHASCEGFIDVKVTPRVRRGSPVAPTQ